VATQQTPSQRKVLKFSLDTMHQFSHEELQKVITQYDKLLKNTR